MLYTDYYDICTVGVGGWLSDLERDPVLDKCGNITCRLF